MRPEWESMIPHLATKVGSFADYGFQLNETVSLCTSDETWQPQNSSRSSEIYETQDGASQNRFLLKTSGSNLSFELQDQYSTNLSWNTTWRASTSPKDVEWTSQSQS